MSYLSWCSTCQFARKYFESTEENKSNIELQLICPVCIHCNYDALKGGCHSVVVTKGIN